jgi:hypothetical protein
MVFAEISSASEKAPWDKCVGIGTEGAMNVDPDGDIFRRCMTRVINKGCTPSTILHKDEQ